MSGLHTRLFIFAVLYCRAFVPSYAQSAGAWSLRYALPEPVCYFEFSEPVKEIEQILKEENDNRGATKARVYAAGINVRINPDTSGQWDTIPGKGYVWRMGIRAVNALSLSLLLENYRLQPGEALYVYDKAATRTAGPFDAHNNKNGGILPVESLPGNDIIIEWNVPSTSLPRTGSFTVTNVGYGFRDVSESGKTVRAAAASCNVNVNCKPGNRWQRERRSVVRLSTIIYTDGAARTQYCTGILVNQAVDAADKKPYILTARHCISSEEMARRTTFTFNHEYVDCPNTILSIPKTISGADLVATKKELDFTLLELSEAPDNRCNPFYAGWNASPETPGGATGIHHPQGDFKKIAVDNDPLHVGTFSDPQSGLYCDKDAHRIVKKWDVGVTEGGSSGSPIFDSDHLLVGTLSGGDATCANPVNDYYSGFSEQWNRYPLPEESLKPWLDPDNKGVRSLWGYDPLAPFEGKCDTLGHIGYNETKLLLTGQCGYMTGHNECKQISFAEKIINDTVATIIGLEVHAAKVSASSAKVRFSVWRGNDFPIGGPVYAKDVTVPADYARHPMQIYFDRAIEITGNYFIGYSIDYSQPSDTFAAYQSAKRPYAGVSALYVEENDGTWKASGEDAVSPVYSSLAVKAIGKFGKHHAQPYQPPFRDLKIVYQPGNESVLVYFENPDPNATVQCYDASGRQMPLNEWNRYMVMYNDTTYLQIELHVNNLPYGMYFIRVSDKKKTRSGKFIRL